MTRYEDETFGDVYEHLAAQHLPPADPGYGYVDRLGGGGGNKGPVPGFWYIGGWVSLGGGQTATRAEAWTRIAKAVPVAATITWMLIIVVLAIATVSTIMMLSGV